MGRPKAYEPQQGYKYQLLYMGHGSREYESIDYAVDRKEKEYLINEYRLAFGGGRFKAEMLPQKYWA